MFQFPPSPTVNQTFTPVAGVTYRWSGTAWHLLAGPSSFITQADADTRYVNIDEAQNTTNRIINGKMAIDQRNAGAVSTVTTGVSPFVVDRWHGVAVGTGALQINRTADGVYLGDFQLGSVVSTADAALAAGDYYGLDQSIEGFNVADLNFGSGQVSSFTFAFEIYSSVTGTFCVCFRNGAVNRSYVATFTVNIANTREQKVITVPADLTGTWDKTNGAGLNVSLTFGVGTTFHAPSANVWHAGNFVGVAGLTNFMAAAANVMYLKNVRLYKGSVDFGPDRRLYAEELALCQRYYCKTFRNAVAPAAGMGFSDALLGQALTSANAEPFVNWQYPVQMRATPTITLINVRSGGAAGQWSNTGGTLDSANAGTVTPNEIRTIITNSGVSLSPGQWGIAATASAEL